MRLCDEESIRLLIRFHLSTSGLRTALAAFLSRNSSVYRFLKNVEVDAAKYIADLS